MGLRSYLLKHLRTLNTIRLVLAVLLGAMVVIDIILVILGDEYPTFSEVVEHNRSELIWLNFLLSGLIAKIYFNRKVTTKKKEISGFFGFLAIIILLFAIGQIEGFKVEPWHQVLVMICGAYLGHRVWPQYIFEEEDIQELKSNEMSNL